MVFTASLAGVSLLVVLVALWSGRLTPLADPSLSYPQFLSEVKAGRVDRIAQTGNILVVALGDERFVVAVPSGVDVQADVLSVFTPRTSRPAVYYVKTDPGASWLGIALAGLLPAALVLGLAIWVRAAHRFSST